MKLYRKFKFIFTKSEIKESYFIFLGFLMVSILEIVGIASVVPFISTVLDTDIIHTNAYLMQLYKISGADSRESFLTIIGLVFLVLLLLSNAFQVFMMWRLTLFSNLQAHRISKRLLEQYLRRPYSFFLGQNTSNLSKNILHEVSRAVGGVFLQIMNVIAKAIMVVAIFIFLIVVDAKIAIVTILVYGGIYLIIYNLVKDRTKRMGILVTEANSKRFKIADEGMSSIKDIKLNHNESFFIDLFSKSSKIFAINNSIQVIIGSFPRYILEIVSFGMIVGIIVYMSMNEYNSSEIIPIVSVYAMSGYKLMPALQQIYVSIATMKYNISAVDILINDFKDDYNIEKKQNLNSSRMFFLDKLNLNNLYFSYPSRKENVINGLDLSIGSGSIVGIAGKTGSGKTTLVDIILGLLTKKSGEFNIDGSEVLNNNVRSWQKNIGYVPQNIYIIDDTIANNIAFSVSKEDIDFNKVEFVAKLAKLDDFILNLPDKYETNVGERGVCISGGQRQRIGIARALYNDPLVLVLDEATSALDGITEREILNSIHSISRKITIIMIAHRISTLKRCDAIHIMDEGRIIDSGTYKYLMSNNEYFRKMSSY